MRWLSHLIGMSPGHCAFEVVFFGPCNRQETSSLTRNTQERLCISSGLWLLPDPPGRARKPCCGQRYQSYLTTATWPQKVIEMDTLEPPPHTHTHKQQRQIIPLFKYYLLFCLIFSWFQSFLFIPSFSFWTSFLSFHCFSLLLLYCVPVTKQHTDALRKFLFCSLTLPLTHSPPYFFSLISAISASLPRSLAVYLNL